MRNGENANKIKIRIEVEFKKEIKNIIRVANVRKTKII